jgi:DNA polymerase III subunit gamma/tau
MAAVHLVTISPGIGRMSSINFASKHRPHTFEKVRGQPHPVRFLSGLIQRGQVGRSLLLHGAIGSGKTSLVRIYARALNCDAPTEEGSPCLGCQPCLNKEGFHEYDTSGDRGDRETVLDWVRQRNRRPRGHKWNVLFFDEAHSLTSQAADALLKQVEEPEPQVIFCFATTEYERIRPALRSRLIGFEIKPLPANQAIKLLQECALEEGIKYEPGALELLAGLRQGYARDLLIGLEQVSDPGGSPITVARVREVFDVDHTDHLLAYASALALGDPAAQEQTWFGWNEAAATKIRWLQALLTGLYYNDVLGRTLVVDALISSILPPERAPILAGFRKRLGVVKTSALAPHWRAMMAYWPVEPDHLGETALQMRIALFHYFVNHELPALEGAVRIKAREPRSVGTNTACAIAGQASTSHSPVEGGARFPTINDVHGIIESASFLAQEHDRLFNAHILIKPALMGADEEKDAVALIAAFCEELDAEFAGLRGEPFARLSLIERDLDRGGDVTGRILIHLPEYVKTGPGIDAATSIMARVQSWRRDVWLKGCDAVVVATAKNPSSLAFHWDSVIDLCAGLGDEELDWDPVRNELAPVLDLLDIPARRRRRIGGIAASLVGRSALLGPAAVSQARETGMSLLSALTANRWDLIRSGWELKEHKDRQRTKEERRAALALITESYGEPAEARERREVLLASWQRPPEERQRRAWRGWWLPAEV